MGTLTVVRYLSWYIGMLQIFVIFVQEKYVDVIVCAFDVYEYCQCVVVFAEAELEIKYNKLFKELLPLRNPD